MQHQLLDERVFVTKLYPPTAGHAALLSRDLPPRLRSVSPRLYLLLAPVGAGKTSLLRQLWQTHAGSAAWLSLDETDNDLRRFLSHLLAAIAVVRPDAMREAQTLLQATQQVQVDRLLSVLINALAEETEPLLLCLDDYHEISSMPVHHFLGQLLRFLPPGISLALATRHEPPLALGQLRARGEVAEIAWNELHFSQEEAVTFLLEVRRLALTPEQAEQLAAQTEGWPAGLQLVAAALERGVPPTAVLRDKAGAETRLRDFLLESVWEAQPPEIRQFLIDTALLDRFCLPLCDALGGSEPVGRLLQQNLFIFQLHGDRDLGWYRFHQLFREFLLSRRPPDEAEKNRILLTAARWCAARGYPREALEYALRGEDWDFAADLLQKMGRAWLLQRDTRDLSDAIDRLPQAQIERHPKLYSLQAWALLYLGDTAAAGARLDALDNLPGLDAAITAESLVLRVILGVVRSDDPELSNWRHSIIDELERDDGELLAFGHAAEGYVLRAAGQLAASAGHFRQAEELSLRRTSHSAYLLAAYNTIMLKIVRGNLLAAEAYAHDVLETTETSHWQHVAGAGFIQGILAIALYEQFRLSEALDAIDSAIEILRSNQTYSYLGIALCERARILFAQGEAERARYDLRFARRVAREHRIQRAELRAEVVEMRAELRAGNVAAAAARQNSGLIPSLPEEGALNERQELLLIEWAYLQLAEGRSDHALLQRLDAGLAGARAAGRLKTVAELELQRAALLARQGLTQVSKNAVAAARAIAEQGGFRRILLFPMPDIAPLLGTPVAAAVSTSPQPFRQRELQILQLVAQGMSNREIGQRLFISETTVKWYLKHLYQILDVNSRTAAVAKARQLCTPGV